MHPEIKKFDRIIRRIIRPARQEESYGSSVMLSGDAVKQLPDIIKAGIAEFICQRLLLEAHVYTMLPFTKDELMYNMENGMTIVAFTQKAHLAGFGQVWPLNRFWRSGVNLQGQKIIESGTWFSFRGGEGIGEKIMKETVKLGRSIDPNAQIVAIIEEGNEKAQRLPEKNGAEKIGFKFSPIIPNQSGNAAFMHVYDITNV